MDGSRHPLPLTTVYRHFHPVDASPYSSLNTLFGHEYLGSVLEEVKILPLGKEISAVGLYSFKNGVPEVKPCKDFPYFLSEMSKDQMVVDLTAHTQLLLLTGIVLGSVSIGVLGYSVARNWNGWKMWKQRRQLLQAIRASESNIETQVQGADAEDDVPRHQLCVVCHTSRRQYAFIPCGHLLCCQSCSALVKSHVSPKCPLCQMEIHVSVMRKVRVGMYEYQLESMFVDHSSRFNFADRSYCKAKYAAERFHLLQFAACPFTLIASKLTPHPSIQLRIVPRGCIEGGDANL